MPGLKVEDTVLAGAAAGDPEVLTRDPAWPTIDVNGRVRPAILER